MTNETTHIVYWEGPFSPKKMEKFLKKGNSKKLNSWVLYSVYGSHPLYGDNVLLYIGMIDDVATKNKRTVAKRLQEHQYWFDEQYFGDSKIYLASIDENEFSGWKEFEKVTRFNHPQKLKFIKSVESLLIYSHQPAYNTKNRYTANDSHYLRLFNTGAKGLLSPEVSGLFHLGNPSKFDGDQGDN